MSLEHTIVDIGERFANLNLSGHRVKERLQQLADYHYDDEFDCEAFEKQFPNPIGYMELVQEINSYNRTERALNRVQLLCSSGYGREKFREDSVPGAWAGIKALNQVYGNILAWPANRMLNRFGHVGQFAVYSLEIVGALFLGTELFDNQFLQLLPLAMFSPSAVSITCDGQPTNFPEEIKELKRSWDALQKPEIQKELYDKGMQLRNLIQEYFHDCE